MVVRHKTEIDVRRLLVQCEKMASEAQRNEKKIDWRLTRYLRCLDKQISMLEKDDNNKECVGEFKRKVNFFKDIVKADEMTNSLDGIMLCQHLLPSAVVGNTLSFSGQEDLSTVGLGLQVRGKHHKDLRNELFGDDNMATELRKRRSSDSTKDDINNILKSHHDMQEKVANEMIKMAQSMKHNSLVARDIIRADNVELNRASKLVERNNEKLKVESDRLEELNNRRCSWMIWIMLIIICIVFINMIIFIKFFPKKVS